MQLSDQERMIVRDLLKAFLDGALLLRTMDAIVSFDGRYDPAEREHAQSAYEKVYI